MALEKIRPRVVDETGNYTFNNVTATGNLVSLNANLGNIAVANYVKTDNLLYANGVPWSFGTASGAGGSNTQVQFNDSGTFAGSANFTFDKTSNTLTVGNISVGNITANGAGLSSIAGANITGTVANANYAAYAGNITIAAQSNITSLGTLSSLDVTGNISGGNANLGNLVIANYFSGSGNNLSNIQGSNVTGAVSYATTANAVAGANVSGQVTYAATANAVAGGNVMGAVGLATYATTANAVAGANVSGQVANALIAGTVYTNAQPNITSVGTLSSLAVTGNITSGNANLGNAVRANYFVGNGYYLTGVDQLTVGNADIANRIANGTSNVDTPISGGNITVGIGGTANTAIFTTSGITANRFTGNLFLTLTGTSNAEIVRANIADNDFFRILVGGTASDSGFVEFATADGGNEPIYFRQYTNSGSVPFSTVTRTLTLLDGNGDTSIPGNLTLSGNLIVGGTTTSVNSTVTRIVDPIFELGGGANGAALSADDNKDRGLLLHYYSGASTVDAFMGWDDSNAEFAFGSNVTLSSEVTTFNTYGNIRANFLLGNGYYLTGIDQLAAGSADAANYIANGTSNINTPVLNGNITVGIGGTANTVIFTTTGVNIAGYANLGSGNLTTTGNATAAYFLGNGSQLTGISAVSAGYIQNGTSNVNIASSGGNITLGVGGTANVIVASTTGVNVTGTLTTTANISAGSNYFLGNGYYLTGIDAAGQLANGTSNIRIPTAGANITFTVNGTTAANITSSGFVLLGTGNITAGNVYANAGTIGASALTGTLSTANQYNVTNVGTLGNLAVTSNITSGNVYANSGIVKGQYIYGDGSNLTGLGGAGYIFNGTSNVFIATAGGNVSFTVGGYTNILNVTTTGANIGGYANVTGNLSVVGNITGGNANLGNAVVANYFTGNFYGNANTAGTVITASQPNITSVGTLTSLDVTGTANLGTASNVKIGGGAANYFLKTDGSGNLSWAVPAGGGGGGGTSLTYTAGTNPPATGNILGDQWFNTSGNILYEYISDGSASYWVDISSPSFSTTPGTSGTSGSTDTISPFLLMGA